MRFAAGRSVAMNKHKIQKETEERMNKYKIPDEKHTNNSLDEIRLDIKNKSIDYEKNKTIDEDKIQDKKAPLPRNKDFLPLTIRKFPWFFWMIGIVILVVTFLMLYNIVLEKNSPKRFLPGFDGSVFWHYIVLGFGFGFGISFFVVAKYEKLILDKHLDIFHLTKLHLLYCKIKAIDIKISDIKHIYPIKIITKANSIKSTIYKIGIVHNNNKNMFFGKSLWESSVINEIIKIRFYLFGFQESYEKIKGEMVENRIELSPTN